MIAFEPVYIAAGLGQINDTVNMLFDEHEPLGERIEAAGPTSFQEMAAVIGVFHRVQNHAIFRGPRDEDWPARLAFRARDFLASIEDGAPGEPVEASAGG